jgi:hypothetical protein
MATLQRTRFLLLLTTRIASAKIPTGQIQFRGSFLNIAGIARELAVVVTETVKVDGVLALTVAIAGTVHVAPVGAPVQLNEAVPAIPAPPMASM